MTETTTETTTATVEASPELDRAKLKAGLEALLFITDRPLTLAELSELLGSIELDVSGVLDELRSDYALRGGVQILNVAEGFQMGTRPECGEAIRKLYKDRTTFRLSTAALETLSIVAYKQPLTRAEIEEIRGVEVIAALETLLEKRLLKVVGRKEAIGRPLLYGTTSEFLRQFGLRALEDLPPLDTLTPVPAPTPAGPQGPFALPEVAVQTEIAQSEDALVTEAGMETPEAPEAVVEPSDAAIELDVTPEAPVEPEEPKEQL